MLSKIDNFTTFMQRHSAPNVTPLADAQNIILAIINWVLVAIFIAAFVYLVLAGVKYITSGGDAARAAEARLAIIHAIIGIVVVTLALFIIQASVNFGMTTVP